MSEALAERVLSLPMHAYLEPSLQGRIAERVHALRQVAAYAPS